MDLEHQTLETQQQFVCPDIRPETSAVSNTFACNLGSYLSFSCRSRAESFARKLQLKLKTLGNNDTSPSVEESMQVLIDSNSPTPSSYTWTSTSEENPVTLTSEFRMDFHKLSCHNNNINNNNHSEDMKQIHEYSSNENPVMKAKASTDSDFFFDFDIDSPGSPAESGNPFGFTVINPCDDLYCKDCVSSSQTGQPCHKKHMSGTTSESGLESGCVFSSPASTSPDGCANGHTEFGTSTVDKFSTDFANEDVPNGIDIGDCNSDASDSIYYDVESSFSSSSSCSSPKISEEILQQHRPETNAYCDQLEQNVKCYNCDTVEPPLVCIENISQISLEDTEIAVRTVGEQTGGKEESNITSESRIDDQTQSQENEQAKSPLHVDVEGATLNVSYNRQLLSPNSDDDEDRPRIQRSSSLKTGKTPPGTPGRKKIVRFADVLGLDLADVRTFLDEIPSVPKSAYRHLDGALDKLNSFTSNTLTQRPSPALNKTLLPSFHQPVSVPDFFDRIRDKKVLLENAFLADNFTIKGTVRVMNMDFHKSVYIRYTFDEWKTFTDFQTRYVSGSCDGFSDKFEFSMKLSPDSVEIGGRLTFACRFHCQGQQFWDNNSGRNYVFHCVPASSQSQQSLYDLHTHSPAMEDPWINHMWM